ncbi:MAG: methylaspartate mutase accessory protein GlmL, partial [Dehalococcoidia bacterium]|nr:methylaspartate mutase accessory protein GlmL [Dehalococcoidia bacterium]
MDIALLVDFGSTYTKLALVDLDSEVLVGTAQSPSTVNDNMMKGFHLALAKLLVTPDVKGRGIKESDIGRKLACSSAAGGLRLVAIGLVPQLTLEAARRAALGAGAKVVGSFSHELTKDDVKAIEQKPCDIILLSGGTDGGNRDVVTHNARMLAACKLEMPIIVAANRVASPDACEILRAAGKDVELTENVLPDLGTINVEPARNAIRAAFIHRIVRAKGLDKAQEYLGGILMPTPMATLKAAELLANGTEDEPGLGELMVVEVGGATTNVHSVATGRPTKSQVTVKGLPEPYAKRTVEGDLGIRYNAATIVDLAGEKKVLENMPALREECPSVRIRAAAQRLSEDVGFVPQTECDIFLDVGLASTAVQIASTRHAGTLSEVFTPLGTMLLLHGKDLTEIKTVIGTGGIFAYGRMPEAILQKACFSDRDALSLRPKAPDLFIDRRYILYGVGLLSEL